MVKCGCASDRCSCTIIGGDGVVVSGTGSQDNPTVVAIDPSAVFTGGGDASLPSGLGPLPFAGPVAPAGWLLCQGQELSRTVYAALFAVIGVAYGAGDGTTTFNIPDMTDRVPLGAGGSHARGTKGGTGVLTTANLPSHTHGINHDHAPASTASGGAHDHNTYHNDTDGTSTSTFRSGSATGRVVDPNLVGTGGDHSHTVDLPSFTGTSGATGSGSPAPVEPPFTATNYIIKA